MITKYIIGALAGSGIMAWFLVGMAWWFSYANTRPSQRQINQTRTVRKLAALVENAQRTNRVVLEPTWVATGNHPEERRVRTR